MFFKIGLLKNFAIFTGKHLCWSLLIKLQVWRPAKRLQHRCFRVNIAKFLWISFLQNTSIGCSFFFKKCVNFPVKHQFILDIYITWVIFQQFSRIDLKSVAFLVFFKLHGCTFKFLYEKSKNSILTSFYTPRSGLR